MSEETTRNFPGDDLKGIHARFDSLDGRLTTLEDKVDRRLQETRPIWEQVLAKLDGLETEMRRGFRKLDRQMSELAGDVIEVRVAQHDLEKRMDKLEDEREHR
ncbi:MAG TPA: hypothetical protein VFS10_01930 [Pyrinomonadaceae bacterium]|nr:hypothetical protein [Pyrinomonadaceae bacterium]